MEAIEKYIFHLPDNELFIAAKLREWILAFNPSITEKLRYGIPFFDYHGWTCYLKPLPKGGGVELCFLDALLMKKTAALLQFKERKTVASRLIATPVDLDYSIFKQLMQEAIHIRNTMRRKK